jgi:hypothetical protein
MSLALTTTYEKRYFPRSIPFCDIVFLTQNNTFGLHEGLG